MSPGVAATQPAALSLSTHGVAVISAGIGFSRSVNAGS